ncbi:MAG TPA: YlmC/YmxH family sporulation protein [Firmicutes bacterium]|nr:YlmC/YmxH family sporulation protein [Bacillota bacterium]
MSCGEVRAILVRTSELRTREVINISDGRKLGSVIDVDIDLESGRLRAIVVPGPRGMFSMFGRNEDVVIPWDKIKRIGQDVILVERPSPPPLSR